MFYATAERDRTKLPRDPFKAIVAPRPIGWISTRALDGRINLAPYSFFNGFSSAPPIVGFSSEGWKDSASFAKESGEFVANLATFDLREPDERNLGPVRPRRQRIRPRRTDHGRMPPGRRSAGGREPGRAGMQGGRSGRDQIGRAARGAAPFSRSARWSPFTSTMSSFVDGRLRHRPRPCRSPAAATRITRRSRKCSRWRGQRAAAISERGGRLASP